MSIRLQQRFTLQSPNFSEAPLVADLAHLGLVAEAQLEEGLDRLVELLISGEIVTVGPSEPVRVVDDALTDVRVELLDGSGRSGWAPKAWLHADLAAGRGAA
jgi:hypothetical protein